MIGSIVISETFSKYFGATTNYNDMTRKIIVILAILFMFAIYLFAGVFSLAVLESHEKNRILPYDVWTEPEKLPTEEKIYYHTYRYFVAFPVGIKLWFKNPLEKQDFKIGYALLNPLVLTVVFVVFKRLRKKN